MSGAAKVMKAGMSDLMRGRVIVVHGAFFLLASWGLLFFSEESSRALVSLTDLLLLVIPLVGFVFGTIYFYGSREFLELLLAQPIGRRSVYFGHYLALALSLSAVFVIGAGAPFVWYRLLGKIELDTPLLVLLVAGVLLTFVSTSLAYLLALRFENRIKGFGASILVWLLFTFIYDAFILFVTVSLRAFPLEKPIIVLSLLNPVDLARITVLLELNIAALMGYTGAVFQLFFGTGLGLAIVFGTMLLQITVPLLVGMRVFARKDF